MRSLRRPTKTKQKSGFPCHERETNDTFHVDKGSAPQKTDEIAVTADTLDHLGAEIGDRVTAVINEKEYEFIITGTFSTFVNAANNAAFLYKILTSDIWRRVM